MGWVSFLLTQAFITSVTLGAMKRQGVIQVNTNSIKNDMTRYTMVKMVDAGEDVVIFAEKLILGFQEEYDKVKKERK